MTKFIQSGVNDNIEKALYDARWNTGDTESYLIFVLSRIDEQKIHLDELETRWKFRSYTYIYVYRICNKNEISCRIFDK